MWGKDETEDVLERARIFLRLRRSLRDLFFFHFSLMLRGALSGCCDGGKNEGNGETETLT